MSFKIIHTNAHSQTRSSLLFLTFRWRETGEGEEKKKGGKDYGNILKISTFIFSL